MSRNISVIVITRTIEEVPLAKSVKTNEGQALQWLIDENGRRAFPISRKASAGLTDEVKLPSIAAMADALMTMRSQASLRQ